MRIDVFTSILRRHYTRNEISEIWDTTCEKYLHESDTFEKAVSKPERPLLGYMSFNRSRLQILLATFCDLNVTNIVAELVVNGQSLELDTNSLEEYFGDPWLCVRKTFSLLYQFSDNDERPQLLVTTQGRGTVSIDSSTAGPKAGSISRPLGAAVHILPSCLGTRRSRPRMSMRECIPPLPRIKPSWFLMTILAVMTTGLKYGSPVGFTTDRQMGQ